MVDQTALLAEQHDAAQNVTLAVTALQAAVVAASDKGLKIEIEVLDQQSMRLEYPCPVITASVFKPMHRRF